MTDSDLLSSVLEAAVPLRIAELQVQGGPSSEDWFTAKAFGPVLVEKGDILLYGGKKKGESSKMFNRLAHSIAVLSFLPGGIEIFGSLWETKEKTP